VWVDYVSDGYQYHYKITAIDDSENESDPILPENIVAVEETVILKQIALHQNTPNPFNPYTTIAIDLPAAAHVELEIFDVLGRSVRVLANERMKAGHKEIRWDGTNRHGERVASGVYLCRMRSGSFERTIRMTLVK
jgi:flagellar hook assembly protein FlgD